MSQARTFSDKELKHVLSFVSMQRHAERNRAIILMSFWAGLRAGELAALKYGDVVVEERVQRQISLAAHQTKGDQSRRVFICDKLQRELTRYVEHIGKRDMNAPFFYSQQAKCGMSGNSMVQLIGGIYRMSGLKDARSHSGRRSFITRLAHKGVGVRVLMELAGHRNMSTTQRYIDLNDAILKSAIELI